MKRFRLLSRFRDYFGMGVDTVDPAPGQRMRLAGKGTRMHCRGAVFSVEMGRQWVHLYPDPPVGSDAGEPPQGYILVDPGRFAAGIHHALRLCPGERLSIDRNAPYQAQVFSHPRDAFRRHLQIRHEGNALVFRDPISELGTYVTRTREEAAVARVALRRAEALRKVVKIFGSSIGLLPPDEALATLHTVNRLLRSDPYRRRDSQGNAGGLLELPDRVTPVLISDLHGQVDNLLTILSENAYLESLERGDAALIFLGDVVHREDEGHLESMESSALVMDLVFKLKVRFPAGVFLLLGNHESFSPDVMKGGVSQGLAWSRWLTEARGQDYRDALALFYQQAPLVALSRDFITCHAGPPRAKVSREMLVEVRRFPGLIHEITWTRLRTPGYPAGYGKGDVRRFRKALKLAEDVPFIVGHYPRDRESTLWQDVAKIPHHHIAYCAMPDKLAVFTRVDGVMVPQIYPVRPVLEWLGRQEELAAG